MFIKEIIPFQERSKQQRHTTPHVLRLFSVFSVSLKEARSNAQRTVGTCDTKVCFTNKLASEILPFHCSFCKKQAAKAWIAPLCLWSCWVKRFVVSPCEIPCPFQISESWMVRYDFRFQFHWSSFRFLVRTNTPSSSWNVPFHPKLFVAFNMHAQHLFDEAYVVRMLFPNTKPFT